MWALVTGASSGIGYEMSKYLSKLGYNIIAVARGTKQLEILKNECTTQVEMLNLDLSIEDNVFKLHEMVKEKEIDVLINNAGFGLFGEFTETDINTELNMINLNIKTVHIITKLFIKDMIKKNKGYILNVGSIAGFMPGPLMATYYATKAYVVRITQAINKELKKSNSNVQISVLCPGPVSTNFNKVAGVKFNIKPLTPEYVAKYGIDKLFKKKTIIIPGKSIKVLKFLSKIAPDKIVLETAYHAQTMKK